MTPSRFPLSLVVCLLVACCAQGPSTGPFLFMWTGDADRKASDFLAVIDANPASPGYGSVVASVPTGEVGTHPHHTEDVMPASGHLLANGFGAGRTWLFDTSTPRKPVVLATFGEVGGYGHPHSFLRLPNGNVLATFQYRAGSGIGAAHGDHAAAPAAPAAAVTGGLVEMDERGTLIRSGDARDAAIADSHIYPYAALPMPAVDRVVSTTTDMNPTNTRATSEWVQFWRLSDLTLLKSMALPPGPRGDEHHFTGEPRLLPDGKSLYIHTFSCGLYLLRDVDRDVPTVTFVKGFEGMDCGVPILTGKYWLQPVPASRSLIALDISNPEHPREVSTVTFGGEESPHWVAIDPTGRRVVLNSGGHKASNRLFIVNFDPETGQLAIDDRFRDAGSTTPGVSMTGKVWPHGFTGTAAPHGTVFSRQ